MNPCGSTFSVTALANALALNFSDEELELLSSLFNQLAYTLEVIAVNENYVKIIRKINNKFYNYSNAPFVLKLQIGAFFICKL